MRAAAVIAGSRRPGPDIEPPADIDPRDLAPEVRSQLRTLSKAAADGVARHLVAAGRLVDEDPQAALQHARAARTLGSRVAVVREAVGETAYAAGEWAEAIAELRTARRMSGDDSALPMIADSERALGRADRALRLAQSDEARALGPAERAEMTIVEAGARRDLGQLDAALLTLQDSGLDQRAVEPWSARIWYAYADLLLAAGREDEAREWFVAASGADQDGSTDADERLLELDGVEILDDDEDSADGDLDESATDEADGAAAGVGTGAETDAPEVDASEAGTADGSDGAVDVDTVTGDAGAGAAEAAEVDATAADTSEAGVPEVDAGATGTDVDAVRGEAGGDAAEAPVTEAEEDDAADDAAADADEEDVEEDVDGDLLTAAGNASADTGDNARTDAADGDRTDVGDLPAGAGSAAVDFADGESGRQPGQETEAGPHDETGTDDGEGPADGPAQDGPARDGGGPGPGALTFSDRRD